jgi:hypothetical protein
LFYKNCGGTFFAEKHRNVPLLREYFASEILGFPRTPSKKHSHKKAKMDLLVCGWTIKKHRRAGACSRRFVGYNVFQRREQAPALLSILMFILL